MKKATRLILLLGVLMALLCVSALAAEAETAGLYGMSAEDGVTITPVGTKSTVEIDGKSVSDFYSGAEKLTVSYGEAQIGHYLLLVLNTKTAAPTVDDIVYIDQQTATKAGSVSFTAYPSALGKGTYYVYLSTSASSGLGAGGLKEVGTFESYVPFIRGDVDDSGEVNVGDATRLLQHLAKIEGKTVSGAQLLAADTDKSGEVNVGDATRLLQHLAKLPGKEIIQ